MSTLFIGAGGGWDIVGGYSLYCESQPDTVMLANYSFTDDLHLIDDNVIVEITPDTVPRSRKQSDYFPELVVAQHLGVSVFAIRLAPPHLLIPALRDFLQSHPEICKLCLVDNGFDILVQGHFEPRNSRGSVVEDFAMLCAVHIVSQCVPIPATVVCTSITTENIPISFFVQYLNSLTASGGFLGVQAFSPNHLEQFKVLLDAMPEANRSWPCECLYASANGFDETWLRVRMALRMRRDETMEIDVPKLSSPWTHLLWTFRIEQVVANSSLAQHCMTFESEETDITKSSLEWNRHIHSFWK